MTGETKVPELTPILTDLGLPGLVIGALGWAYWHKSRKLENVYETQAETSRADAKAMAEAQMASADAIRSVTEIVKDIATDLRAGGR